MQNCLENATHELKLKDELVQSINQALQMLEDDLVSLQLALVRRDRTIRTSDKSRTFQNVRTCHLYVAINLKR